MSGCLCGCVHVWVCVCVGFVMCGCVNVWFFNVCVCVCVYGFCNVLVCVCVCFETSECVYA